MPQNHTIAHIIQHSGTEITEVLAPDKFQSVVEEQSTKVAWLKFEADLKRIDGTISREVRYAWQGLIVDKMPTGTANSQPCPFAMRLTKTQLEVCKVGTGPVWHGLKLQDKVNQPVEHQATSFDPNAVFVVGADPATLNGHLVFAVTSSATGEPAARRLWQVDLQQLHRFLRQDQADRRSEATTIPPLPQAGTDQVAGESEA